MRNWLTCLAAIITASPACAGQLWTAACQGGNDAQYVQTINGAGRFSTAVMSFCRKNPRIHLSGSTSVSPSGLFSTA